jgi:hypothetical protein
MGIERRRGGCSRSSPRIQAVLRELRSRCQIPYWRRRLRAPSANLRRSSDVAICRNACRAGRERDEAPFTHRTTRRPRAIRDQRRHGACVSDWWEPLGVAPLPGCSFGRQPQVASRGETLGPSPQGLTSPGGVSQWQSKAPRRRPYALERGATRRAVAARDWWPVIGRPINQPLTALSFSSRDFNLVPIALLLSDRDGHRRGRRLLKMKPPWSQSPAAASALAPALHQIRT